MNKPITVSPVIQVDMHIQVEGFDCIVMNVKVEKGFAEIRAITVEEAKRRRDNLNQLLGEEV